MANLTSNSTPNLKQHSSTAYFNFILKIFQILKKNKKNRIYKRRIFKSIKFYNL